MTPTLDKTDGLMAFVRTVEAGSFSGACRLLGSSQSAVSKSVARLERRLGVRLIQRSTRVLSVTAEGQAYYERIAPLLRAIDDAEEVVQREASANGTLRVSASQDVGRTLIAAWAGEFLTRHPGLKLQLCITDRNVDVIREGFDIAVRIGSLPDTDMIGRTLADLHFVLVASPSYIEKHGAPCTIEDLTKASCLRYLIDGRPWPFTFADGTSIVPSGQFDSDDAFSIRQAALNSAGIAYVIRASVADDISAGRLVPLLTHLPMPSIPVHALHAFGRQLPIRARLFIDFLVEKISGRSL